MTSSTAPRAIASALVDVVMLGPATRDIDRCAHAMPSSAHRSPRREIFARSGAALEVFCCHTCPHQVHR